jgi:histidine triad (HIT) family protein
MDIRPVTSGHTLLVPTSHNSGIAELDQAMVASLFEVAPSITRALYRATGCAGVNWFVADGEAAGQEVFHFHLHLIPRYKGDGFGLRLPPDYGKTSPRQALDEMARSIVNALKP